MQQNLRRKLDLHKDFSANQRVSACAHVLLCVFQRRGSIGNKDTVRKKQEQGTQTESGSSISEVSLVVVLKASHLRDL